MSSEPGSVTRLIRQLQAQTPEAACALWGRFAERMLALARQRLGPRARRVADEEDVVVVAFERFLLGVREGRFPRLTDRDDLWAILFTLTTRQAARLSLDQRREKRGGGAVRGDSALGDLDVADDAPTPDEEAVLQEGLARLLAALKDGELRQIALARMEGHSNAEIARAIGRSEVTVERRLQLIRETWRRRGLAGDGPIS
jgi:DNA-directed RNA polymerase specialized sigma24 family protein